MSEPSSSTGGPDAGGPGTSDLVVTVERLVRSSPERIFALLADPAEHPRIDGSGSVRSSKEGHRRLSLGSRFGMSMKMGIPYSMVSEVVEFEEGRRIAWQTRPPGVLESLGGGRTWRYELEPTDGGTVVRETWDLTRDKQRSLLKRGPLPRRTRSSMEKTLERIDSILSERPR